MLPVTPRRRRWFRISLRTLLLLVTLLCIWLGVKVNQARRQKEAIAALKSIGLRIDFYHQRRDQGFPDSSAEPPAPTWLRQITGDDFFQRVCSLGGNNPDFTDDHAAHLSALDHLMYLTIGDSPASDEALAQIGNTSSLEIVHFFNTPVGDCFVGRLAKSQKLSWLVLDNTRVTAEGLKSLSNLRELKVLNLSNSPIGNDGLIVVGAITKLSLLHLSNLPITNEGIEHLSNLSNLETLTLEHVNVSDAGIKSLKTGPPLRSLNLSGTRIRGDALPAICNPTLEYLHLSDALIDDEVLIHLELAKGLGELYLDGTNITDDGLAHLARLSSLNSLHLGRTKITGSGLRHLAALPNLIDLDLSDTNLSRDGLELLTKLLVPPPAGSSYLALHGTSLDDSTMDVIARLPVTQLFLSRTKITDTGLAELKNMPNLQNIDLTDTAVTPAGVAALKQRIPSLRTVHTSFDRD